MNLHDLSVGFMAVTAVEWVALVLALGYLLLAIRQSPWCWGFAIASSAMYVVVFVRGGLVMQAWLQVFYIAMAIYGWRKWRGSAAVPPLSVSRWPLRWHAASLAAIGLGSTLHGAWLGDAAPGTLVPYADACIAWGSVFATLLETRKILESWLYWIVLDAAAAVLYASQGLQATAVLFVVYSALAIRGYVRWRNDSILPAAASA